MRFLFLLLFTLSAALSSQPSFADSAFPSCPAPGTVYKDSFALSSDLTKYISYEDYSCQVKCTGDCPSNSDGKLFGSWKFTGYGFAHMDVKSDQYYSYKVKYGINAGVVVNSKYSNDFCHYEVSIGNSISFLYHHGFLMSEGGLYRYFAPKDGYTNVSQDVKILVPSSGIIKCQAYSHNKSTGALVKNYASAVSYEIKLNVSDLVSISPEELPSCNLGEIFVAETLSCQPIPRSIDDKCYSEMSFQVTGHYGQPQNMSYNGCHYSFVSSKHMPPEYPDSCYDSIYVSTGYSDKFSDYVFKKDDFCTNNFNPPTCKTGMSFYSKTGLCMGEGFTPYDPVNWDADANTGLICGKLDGSDIVCNDKDGTPPAPVTPPEPDPIVPPVPTPETDAKCSRINGYDFCADAETNKPLTPGEYPEGKDVDPSVCQNGMIGSKCSDNWQNGGYPKIDANAGDPVTNGTLSEFLTIDSDGLLDIDYDSDMSDGEGEEKTEFTGDLLTNNRFMTTDGFNGSYTCPEPEVFVFFENTKYEAVFDFEFDVLCSIGDKYKNVYLAFFIFVLFLAFIRRF